MDILVFLEGLDQSRVLAHMRKHAEFDLGIVGREQASPRLRDEGASDLPAYLGTDRYVLEVGLAAREPAGGGHGLVERGVETRGFRVDHGWKGIDVR